MTCLLLPEEVGFENMKRHVLVIGGSGSLGRALVQRLLEDKFLTSVTSTSWVGKEDFAQRVEIGGGSAVQLNLLENHSIAEKIRAVENRSGPIDSLIYAAGLQVRKPIVSFSPKEIHDIFQVNLLGAVNAVQLLLPGMVMRGFGRFVFVGSLTSSFSVRNISAYGMAKSALKALARSIAVENARDGVTANLVSPGRFETNMTKDVFGDSRRASTLSRIPAGRMGNPQEITGAVAYLLSEDTSYVNGSEIVVDGGWLAGGGNIEG